MSGEVITANEECTVQEAATLMAEYGIGSLLVTKNDLPVGIVTETDFTRRVAQQALAPQTRLREVMTAPIHYTNKDADVIEVANTMKEMNIKKLPVIQGEQLLGVVTQTDIIKHIFDTIRNIEAAYKQGTLTPTEYAQRSSRLFQNFSSTLEGFAKQWHMRCEACGHQFLNAEQDGALTQQACPACNSANIVYDQNPRV